MLGRRRRRRRQRAVGPSELLHLFQHVELLRGAADRIERGVRRALEQQQEVLALELFACGGGGRAVRDCAQSRRKLRGSVPSSSSPSPRCRSAKTAIRSRAAFDAFTRAIFASRTAAGSAAADGSPSARHAARASAVSASIRSRSSRKPRRHARLSPKARGAAAVDDALQELAAVEGQQQVLEVAGVDVVDHLVAREDGEADDLLERHLAQRERLAHLPLQRASAPPSAALDVAVELLRAEKVARERRRRARLGHRERAAAADDSGAGAASSSVRVDSDIVATRAWCFAAALGSVPRTRDAEPLAPGRPRAALVRGDRAWLRRTPPLARQLSPRPRFARPPPEMGDYYRSGELSGPMVANIAVASVRAVGCAVTLAAVGLGMAKVGMMTPELARGLSQFSVRLAIPALLFSSVVPGVSGRVLSFAWPLLLLPALNLLLGLLAGLLTVVVVQPPEDFRLGTVAACSFGNTQGIPIVLLSVIQQSLGRAAFANLADPLLFCRSSCSPTRCCSGCSASPCFDSRA